MPLLCSLQEANLALASCLLKFAKPGTKNCTGKRNYLHTAVTSVASILSRVSGSAVYLSLIKPSKPDCSQVTTNPKENQLVFS